jgi:hypothetical protein
MVVHGPEIFDSGNAAWLQVRLVPRRTIVAGVMARTAAEESGLPVEFDGRPPSRVILDVEGPVFLANHGKTPYSGRVFGDIVASRLGTRGLVQVECSDKTVSCWHGGDLGLAATLARLTKYTLQEMITTAQPIHHTRQIRGCIPGEPVYVNGIIIGRATAETVVLRSDGENVVPVSGLEVKQHGLEKILHAGSIDIRSAWCKSGTVRSAAARGGSRAGRHGRVVVIDHCGHEIYARLAGDCCGVLAIGDDTTAVCGHICVHRGIPVLGITDGILMRSSPLPLHRDPWFLMFGPFGMTTLAGRLPHLLRRSLLCGKTGCRRLSTGMPASSPLSLTCGSQTRDAVRRVQGKRDVRASQVPHYEPFSCTGSG